MIQPKMTLEGFLALVAAAVLAGGYAASGRGELLGYSALVLGSVVAARVYASLLAVALANVDVARRALPQQPVEEMEFRVTTVVEWRSRLPAVLEIADAPPSSARLRWGAVAAKRLVGPGARLALEYTAVMDVMGVYKAGPLRIEARDPLSLFSVALEGWQWVIEVTPRPEPGPGAAPVKPGDVAEAAVIEDLFAARGRGAEVLFTREVGEGEAVEPTSIDWKATARRGRLVVKVFSRDRPEAVWIVYAVDTRAERESAARLARRALGAFNTLCSRGVEARLLAIGRSRVWEAACGEQGYAGKILLKAFIERTDCTTAAKTLSTLEGSVIVYTMLSCPPEQLVQSAFQAATGDPSRAGRG